MDSGSYPPDLTVCKAATREGSGFFMPMDGQVALGRPCPSRHSYILYIVCRERQDAGAAMPGWVADKCSCNICTPAIPGGRMDAQERRCHIDTILALH
jgi:hypothetical protein